MARVLCTIPCAPELISGVRFEATPVGLLSEPISEEAAARFATIPGYRIWDMPDPEPDPDLTAYANAPYEPPTDPAPRRRGRPPKARADDDSLRGGPAL